ISARDNPADCRRSFRSFPAAPTNGSPCWSSWKPGASPTNMTVACGFPTPNTTWLRPSLASLQRWQLCRDLLSSRRDSKLCAKVLESFREDVDDRWRLRYQHEIFRQIVWKPVELKGQGPKAKHC